MFKTLTRHFSSCHNSQIIKKIIKDRTRAKNAIYTPVEQEEDLEKKLNLLYSGQLWLNHAELEARPKHISVDVIQELLIL